MRSSTDCPGSRSGGVLIEERRGGRFVLQAGADIGAFLLLEYRTRDIFYIGRYWRRSKDTIPAKKQRKAGPDRQFNADCQASTEVAARMVSGHSEGNLTMGA